MHGFDSAKSQLRVIDKVQPLWPCGVDMAADVATGTERVWETATEVPVGVLLSCFAHGALQKCSGSNTPINWVPLLAKNHMSKPSTLVGPPWIIGLKSQVLPWPQVVNWLWCLRASSNSLEVETARWKKHQVFGSSTVCFSGSSSEMSLLFVLFGSFWIHLISYR